MTESGPPREDSLTHPLERVGAESGTGATGWTVKFLSEFRHFVRSIPPTERASERVLVLTPVVVSQDQDEDVALFSALSEWDSL